MKISNLRVWNFRSIGSNEDEPGIDVPLKPLTIFVGPNASGKSSTLYSILWIKLKGPLTSSAPSEEEKDVLKDVLGVNSYEDLASGRNLEKWIGVELTFDISSMDKKLKSLFETINWSVCGINKPKLETLTHGFRIRKNEEGGFDYELRFKLDDLEFTYQNVYDPLNDMYVWSLKGYLEERGEGRSDYRPFGEPSISRRVSEYFRKLPEELRKDVEGEIQKIDRFLESILREVEEELKRKLIFIGAGRGVIKLVEKPAATTQNVGYRGEDTLKGLAYAYLNADPDVKRELSSLVSSWAEKFGIHDLNAGLLEEELRAMYKDIATLDLALGSYGHRQLIAFLTQLIVAPRGSIIMIEEPEISLHPENQVLLPLLFADIIKRHDKQVIVTTHSSVLTLAVSDAVSEYGLKAEDVAIYHVTRDKNNFTKVEEVELTEEGYPRHIPSFARVEAELVDKMSERLLG